MDQATTLEYLKDHLSDEIKAQLINIDDSQMDLNTFQKVVQGIATKLEIHSKTFRFSQQQRTTAAKPSSSCTYSAPVVPTTVNTTVIPASTATGTHPGPMDVSLVNRRGLFSTEEKEQRNRLNQCRYCGQAGHIARDHGNPNVLQAKRRAAGIHKLSISSELPASLPSEKATSSGQVAPEDK
ncbi:hypothetical protein MMC07_008115 [Pseudocyphellaria aurata]|nr:hypothetical protein [Pseudocyphellaria aurata]